MKNILITLIFLSLALSNFAQNTGVINADLGRDTISRRIYGHFAEHLGRCIYDGFYVGESSKIPNKDGVRTDIIEALKKLKVGNLRWPGGCFADTYQWKDGIGPKKLRPSMKNVWWGGITEDNSFGTHDFLNLCEAIGAEPYMAGNVGSGSVKDLTDWVSYTGQTSGSPMADLRIKNGREKPWKPRLWGVGNEAWGCGGNMKVDYYANIYKQYATFMTDWGNSDRIFRVASGANGDDYNWTEVLMRDIPLNLMEGVALHHYSVIDWNKKGSATAFSEELYFKTMKQALRMEELVTKHSTIMDKYDPAKKIALVVDEWGGWYEVEPGTNGAFLYQQNTMRDAMIAGTTLNIFNNHCERVRIANLAQTVNVLQAVILTNGEKMLLTPTYHVMEMYNVHQDALLLPLDIRVNDYVLNGEKLPAVSASASRNKAGKVHISLVNIDPNKTQEVTISLRGMESSKVNARILTSGKVQDFNSFENPEMIKPGEYKDFSLKKGELKVSLPAVSVVVLEVE
jgi:alpha-L-arabinofuranosidase